MDKRIRDQLQGRIDKPGDKSSVFFWFGYEIKSFEDPQHCAERVDEMEYKSAEMHTNLVMRIIIITEKYMFTNNACKVN